MGWGIIWVYSSFGETNVNKLLLKLVGEAGFHQPEMERLGIEHKFQKLAELIAKECTKIAFDYDKPKLSGAGMLIGSEIEQHFGIKE